jgi:hypothetical protein
VDLDQLEGTMEFLELVEQPLIGPAHHHAALLGDIPDLRRSYHNPAPVGGASPVTGGESWKATARYTGTRSIGKIWTMWTQERLLPSSVGRGNSWFPMNDLSNIADSGVNLLSQSLHQSGAARHVLWLEQDIDVARQSGRHVLIKLLYDPKTFLQQKGNALGLAGVQNLSKLRLPLQIHHE